jgi:hypothetical protein
MEALDQWEVLRRRFLMSDLRRVRKNLYRHRREESIPNREAPLGWQGSDEEVLLQLREQPCLRLQTEDPWAHHIWEDLRRLARLASMR